MQTKHKFEHLTAEERNAIARAHGCDVMGVRGDMYKESQTRFPRASTSSSAEFTTDIDKAMGIEPQAAWPVIARLYDSYGWSAWYDLGVVCISVLGLGTMYLCKING